MLTHTLVVFHTLTVEEYFPIQLVYADLLHSLV